MGGESRFRGDMPRASDEPDGSGARDIRSWEKGIRSAATAQLDGLCAIESKPGLLYNSERCARIVKGVPANSAANF